MQPNPLAVLESAGGANVAVGWHAKPPAPASGFRDARRVQQGLTAAAEKRLLVWLAERTPQRINSDHLTALGVISMFLAGASYAWARWSVMGLPAAAAFIALNWLGDSLDGTLARVRHSERPRYGYYVDHVLDMFGAFFLTAGLAVSGYVDWRIAAGVFVSYLMLSVEVYLATHALGEFHLSFWRFGPTELRILIAAGNLMLWARPMTRALGTPYRLLDFGGCVAIAGLLATLVVTTVRHIIRLYRIEAQPLRTADAGGRS